MRDLYVNPLIVVDNVQFVLPGYPHSTSAPYTSIIIFTKGRYSILIRGCSIKKLNLNLLLLLLLLLLNSAMRYEFKHYD
jgi:hypothetical protein